MLNEKLSYINEEIDNYIVYDKLPALTGDDKESWVLDIEVCPTSELKDEILVYSIAIMSCYGDNICYKYNNVKKFIEDLVQVDSKLVNIYVHNLYYDIKPIMLEFFNMFGNNELTRGTYEKKEHNKITGEDMTLLYEDDSFIEFNKEHQYSVILNKNQLYQLSLSGRSIKRKYGKKSNTYKYTYSNIVFKDTLKLMPFSLQKCCKEFIGLDLPKDGLDYDKIRKADDELSKEEKIYIYNDVYGLSHLVSKMVLHGEVVNGRHIVMDKLTSSGQALDDYKYTLMEDYENKQNAFADNNLYDEIDNRLYQTSYFTTKKENKKKDIMFRMLFPELSFAEHGFIKHSYYGGLCCVDFENVAKFQDDGKTDNVVLDVNSLYPSMMSTKLLPYGRGYFSRLPYEKQSEQHKKRYPLYFQEITIHDMKVKPDKMHWVQVKDRIDFNGKEVIKENINLNGEKVTIKLILSDVLLKLLFECYDVKSYELGKSISFKGHHDLFKNYIDFWSEVKKTSTGSRRATAKLRLNGLYGKFGSSATSELMHLENNEDIFTVNHSKVFTVRESIYMPMASYITSYAKEFLVKAINSNRDKFMYCDTDSLHLHCSINEVQGVTIHSKNFNCWDFESSFTDFRYVGAKRYAEKINGKWEIKCCGLTDKIMKQVNDIEVFTKCEIEPRKLEKMKLYTKDDVYYYEDEQCTKRIKGLIRSSKARQVKKGTRIIETPYAIR